MVKLMRLTTRNKNCQFTAQLQNDLVLNPDSKIALLNLTFTTSNLANAIDRDNELVDFSGSTVQNAQYPFDLQPLIRSEIPNKIYENKDFAVLLQTLENALNRTLDAQPTTERNQIRTWNTVYSEFYIPTEDKQLYFDERVAINFRYCLLITPLGGQGPFQNPPNDAMTQNDPAWESSETLTVNGNGEPVFTSNFNTDLQNNVAQLRVGLGGASALDSTKHKFFCESDMKMGKGASIFFTRIQLLVDNGSGNEDNGFAIGLTSTDLQTVTGLNIDRDTTEIPASARNFEIRCNRPGEVYRYVNNSQTMNVAGIAPQQVASNVDIKHHDIMWFRIDKGVIRGGVWTSDGVGTGTETVFFTHILTEEQQTAGFYPYLYMRGSSAHCVAEGMSYSVTSFISQNENYAITGKQDNAQLLNELMPGGYNASPIGDLIPMMDPNRIGFPLNNLIHTQTSSLRLALDVWHMLGFSQYKDEDNDGFEFGYRTIDRNIGNRDAHSNSKGAGWAQWKAESAKNERSLSNNFIVEILNVATESYDASKPIYSSGIDGLDILSSSMAANLGRRKNILMTLPVNDNDDKTVEYDTIYPIFIDLLNAEKVNLRNLQIRVLDKNFKQIETTGESILTLLIEN